MTPAPRHPFLADLSLLVTAVIWGVNITVVKASIETMDALTFNALRMTLSTVTLGLLAWAESRIRPAPRQPWPVKTWLAFAAISGIFYPLLFMFGIDRTTAGNTALLLASMPMWTALISYLCIHERLPGITWLGLAVSLAGTGLIISAGGSISFSASYLIGNLLILGASACWASATVVSGPILRRVSPLWLSFWTSLATTPFHLALTCREIPHAIGQLDRPGLLVALVFSGTLSTGLAYATWHYGVRQLGGSHAAVSQNLVTVVAVATAWIFLSEPVLLVQIAGGAVLFTGLYLIRRGRRRDRPGARPAESHAAAAEAEAVARHRA